MDIVDIALCDIVGEADSFNNIELSGKSKETWLRIFLELPNRIHSYDTFNRVFSLFSPEEFSRCFVEWTASLGKRLRGVMAIDGKTLRRSFDSATKKSTLHVVSEWSSENGPVLGQARAAAKSNEIAAISKLVEMLNIEGCIVIVDVMGCRKSIARTILYADA